MSTRRDIATNELDYSCNCGWIDWGHARPDGARALWMQISGERQDEAMHGLHARLEGHPAFIVTYGQSALVARRLGLRAGVRATFLVRRGLSLAEKKSVDSGNYLGLTWERFDRPRILPCSECTSVSVFPPELTTIVPSRGGADFAFLPRLSPPRDVITSIPLSDTFDVDEHGQVHGIGA